MKYIDCLRVEGMTVAEHRCRKLCMGEVNFSPTMIMKGCRMYLYKLVVHCKQQWLAGKLHLVSSRKIWQLA